MSPPDLLNLLWYGSIALQSILWLRLLTSGLWRRYPAFTLYIFSLEVESLTLVTLVHQPKVYGPVWIALRSIVLVFEAAAVLAIFSRWTVSFPGIGAFGRRLIVVLMAISIGISVSTFPIAWSANGGAVAFQLTTLVNRATNLCCSSFLLLTIGFFSKFGGPVAPNLSKHSWTMTALVTANAVSYFVMSTQHFLLANILLPSVALAALAFWILALTERGEAQPVSTYNEAECAEAEIIDKQLQNLATTWSKRGPKNRD